MGCQDRFLPVCHLCHWWITLRGWPWRSFCCDRSLSLW